MQRNTRGTCYCLIRGGYVDAGGLFDEIERQTGLTPKGEHRDREIAIIKAVAWQIGLTVIAATHHERRFDLPEAEILDLYFLGRGIKEEDMQPLSRLKAHLDRMAVSAEVTKFQVVERPTRFSTYYMLPHEEREARCNALYEWFYECYESPGWRPSLSHG